MKRSTVDQMNEIILYIKKNPNKALYEQYKWQCLEHYAKLIQYHHDIEILIGKNGKPLIQDNPFYFNISHSYDYYLLACFSSPIGIDIEKHRKKHYQKIAERFYTIEEINYVQQYDKQGFFDIWCMKESYTKYLGENIFHILSDVNMCQNQQLIDNNDDCYFTRYPINSDYSCCLVTHCQTKIKEIYF